MTQQPQQQPYGNPQTGAYGPPAGLPYSGAAYGATSIPQQRQPAPPRKPRRWITIGLLAGLVVIVLVGVVVNIGSGPSRSSAEQLYLNSARTSASEFKSFDDDKMLEIGTAVCAQPQNSTMVSTAAGVASAQRVSQAGAETVVRLAAQNLCPSRTWAGTPAATPQRTTAPTVAAPVVPVATGPAKVITAREWLLIAKDPDAHKGERVIVYGEVKQFDSATGDSGFRANVDGVVHPVKYGYVDYETNTVLRAGSGVSLAQVVQDDLFKAEVTVVGSYSYRTQIGGNTTVPMLLITKIEVTGSTAG